MIIDPNVDDATYDLTLGDGRKLKIKVNKNHDGTRYIYAIGENEPDQCFLSLTNVCFFWIYDIIIILR